MRDDEPFWREVLDFIDEEFGRVVAFPDSAGLPAIHVLGDGHMIMILTTLPDTVIDAMPGRRAHEVIAHRSFAPGTRNGELVIAKTLGCRRGSGPVEAIAIEFHEPVDTKDIDDA